MGKRRQCFLSAGGLAAVCLILAFCLWGVYEFLASGDAPASPDDYSVPGTVRYGFKVRNTTNRVVSGAVLSALAPVRQTSSQWCADIEASTEFELEHDDLGNQVIVFSLKPIPPFGTSIISVTATLRFSQGPLPVGPVNPFFWLGSETSIENDAPIIRERAAALRKAVDMETARACADWVGSAVDYTGYRSASLGALHALVTRRGDCTEFMSLFVALCRANQIPARCIGGYLVRGNERLRAVDYHNWAEFFAENRWHCSDPQNRRFQVPGGGYVAMEILGPGSDLASAGKRYWFTGAGLVVSMN